VLWYEFYESSAAVRENSELFVMCIIIKLQEKMQYCLGPKNSKKKVHWFCDQRNIEFSPGS
jgi:hypothetical protein